MIDTVNKGIMQYTNNISDCKTDQERHALLVKELSTCKDSKEEKELIGTHFLNIFNERTKQWRHDNGIT